MFCHSDGRLYQYDEYSVPVYQEAPPTTVIQYDEYSVPVYQEAPPTTVMSIQ